MGERKVLNPPDFDPTKIPRRRKQEKFKRVVRSMLPMTVRCTTCGTFLYKGTKFTSLVEEDRVGDPYLGEIKVFHINFKCTNCSSLFIIKTDSKNCDYVVEFGATRSHEPADEEADSEKRKRESEEHGTHENGDGRS